MIITFYNNYNKISLREKYACSDRYDSQNSEDDRKRVFIGKAHFAKANAIRCHSLAGYQLIGAIDMIPFLDCAYGIVNRIKQKAGTEGEERYGMKLKFPKAYEKNRQ